MLQPVPPPPGMGYVIPDEPYVPAPIPAELKRKAVEKNQVKRIQMFPSHPLAASSSRRSGSAAPPSQGREIETKELSGVIKTFTSEQVKDGRMAQGFARAELVVCSPSTNDPKKCRAGTQVDYGRLFPYMRKPGLQGENQTATTAPPLPDAAPPSGTNVPTQTKGSSGFIPTQRRVQAGGSSWAPADVFMEASKKKRGRQANSKDDSRPVGARPQEDDGMGLGDHWEEVVDSETLQHFWVNHSTKEISLKDPRPCPPLPQQPSEYPPPQSSSSSSLSSSSTSGGWLSKSASEQRLKRSMPPSFSAPPPLGTSVSISDGKKGGEGEVADGKKGGEGEVADGKKGGEGEVADGKKGGEGEVADTCSPGGSGSDEIRSPDRKRGGRAQRRVPLGQSDAGNSVHI